MLGGTVAAAAVLLLAPSALAQNLVVNGSFESFLASWTPQGSGWGNSPFPRTGLRAAGTGCTGAACLDPSTGAIIHQEIPTTPGARYTLSFWYRTNSAADNPMEVQAHVSNGAATGGGAGTCSGSCVFQTQTPVSSYTNATYTFIASSASTRITFLGRNDPSGVQIDDVSVVATPEPIPTLSEWTMILMGTLLAGAGGLYLQRRRLTARLG
jgi:hypothetical protein